MQRSEILELGEREDNISRSLMMMWSVALTGSKPCQMPSEKAIKAYLDHLLLRENLKEIGTALNIQHSSYLATDQEYYQRGGNGHLRQRGKIARMMEKLITLKLVTCLLKRKHSGA